jgi:uncharacterized RDD family membrane protein YckC
MVYEAMLLFGVVFIAGWLFSTLLQQRHALYLRSGLQYWLFLVLGMYFVWFWTHGGQTLAMKTWRIRLVTAQSVRVNVWHAMARYVLSWMWFLPGLMLAWGVHARGWWLALIPMLNVALWGAMAFMDPERQFLHDRLARTRLIRVPASAK